MITRAILLAGAVLGATLVAEVAYAARQMPVRQTAADEFEGFAGTSFLGWTQNSVRHPGRYNLFLRDSAGSVLRVNRPGTQGFGGGIDGSTVVYEELVGRSGRLVLYDALARGYTDLPIVDRGGSGIHPTISGAWILYTMGARERKTSVHLYNWATGETRRLAQIAARGRRRFVYSGQIAGEWVVWGRVVPGRQDVFLTNVMAQTTVRIRRPPGVKFQYDPAVTTAGTVFFERSKPCTRHCGKLNTPAMRAQLVELRLGGRPRVLATLRKGQDGGYMYAAQDDGHIQVLYGRFRHLRHNYVTYSDIFAIELPV